MIDEQEYKIKVGADVQEDRIKEGDDALDDKIKYATMFNWIREKWVIDDQLDKAKVGEEVKKIRKK